MRAFLLLLTALTAAACGAGDAPRATARTAPASTAPATTTQDAGPPRPDDGRLPPTIVPTRYVLTLDVDPQKPRFSGTTRITTRVPAAAPYAVLHGRDIHVSRAVAHTAGGDVAITVTSRTPKGALAADELVLRFARPLAPGEATIEIAYDAPFAEGLGGLYRVKDGERWYAFTQFESTDARRAFPCFDEPQHKVPFEITVRTPPGMIAVANTPETSRSAEGGRTSFVFAPTPPLPTYLVALAVGELDVLEAPKKKGPVPIRVITTKGKARLGQIALEDTVAFVDLLTDYFGTPFPYPKLDLVGVPDFAAGAMENAGLITFREEILLVDPDRAPPRVRRTLAIVNAHEIAHQWFGDLVTLAWWDDTWLNEGFATWMETKIVDKYRAPFGARLEKIGVIDDVMDLDGLPSSRAVRRPITSIHDIDETFDGLSYDKGGAVLGMIERFVGEEKFRTAVQSYLRAHAWGSARAEDFLRELDRVVPGGVGDIATSFLDQPGVPAITMERECKASGWTANVTQYPWQPIGAPPPSMPLRSWNVPVCFQADGGAERCVPLREHATVVQGTGRCPAWIYPNAQQSGYYRAVLPERDVLPAVRSFGKLDVATRIGLTASLWSAVRAGSLSADTLLTAIAAIDAETSPFVVARLVRILQAVDDALVDDEVRPAFRAYVRARLDRRKREIGWKPAANEDPQRSELRPDLLFAAGELAADATLDEAEQLTRAWLKDPASLDPDVARTVAELASRRAGEGRFDALRDVVKRSTTSNDRIVALSAMGGFGDPSLLERALDWTLGDEVRKQDVRYVFLAALRNHASRMTALRWAESRWDRLVEKLPGGMATVVSHAVAALCTRESIEEARAFFMPRAERIEAGTQAFSQALGTARSCVDLRSAAAPSVARYFAAKAHGK